MKTIYFRRRRFGARQTSKDPQRQASSSRSRRARKSPISGARPNDVPAEHQSRDARHRIARITWNMVTDAERARKQDLKRKRGGRIIPVHPDLKSALIALLRERDEQARANLSVIFSERARGLSAGAVTVWFFRLYTGLNMVGCSSHSGRRTFLTKAARRVSEVGASLRDFQQLAGHANLATTRPTRTPSGNWWCWYKPVFLTRSTPGRR